jgi:anti-sigma factor RsiW
MPEPTLQSTALRYAAGDLTPGESTAFEERLAGDQEARDAVAEAIRLSAAALHQAPPAPDRSFRAAIRERLRRRASRGHPVTWAAIGAAVVASCAVFGMVLVNRGEPVPTGEASSPATAPAPRAIVAQAPVAIEPDDADSVAEIWADLSTPDQIEKWHDDEQKWRQKLRDASVLSGRAVPVSTTAEPREP